MFGAESRLRLRQAPLSPSPKRQDRQVASFQWVPSTPLRHCVLFRSIVQPTLPRARRHRQGGNPSRHAPEQPPGRMALGQHQPAMPRMLDEPAARLHQPLLPRPFLNPLRQRRARTAPPTTTRHNRGCLQIPARNPRVGRPPERRGSPIAHRMLTVTVLASLPSTKSITFTSPLPVTSQLRLVGTTGAGQKPGLEGAELAFPAPGGCIQDETVRFRRYNRCWPGWQSGNPDLGFRRQEESP